MRSLRLALTFLTIFPVRLRGNPPPLGAAAIWFPVVGAVVGGIGGALAYPAGPAFGHTVAAVIAVGVLVVLTGALHQDGLADCADGLGAGSDRERRLAIMRDSSIGTFGATALMLWLLLMVSALAGLDRGEAWRALIVTAASGRWAVLIHAASSSPARADGLGAQFGVDARSLLAGTALVAAIALPVAGITAGLCALAAAAAVSLLVTGWSGNWLGGRTGDTLGATVALAEAAVALVLLALI